MHQHLCKTEIANNKLQVRSEIEARTKVANDARQNKQKLESTHEKWVRVFSTEDFRLPLVLVI